MFSQTRTRSPERCKLVPEQARSGKRTVPVGDVLVGDTRSYVEHDDTALAVDVVAITKTTELLLTGSVPDVELDLAKVLLLISIRVQASDFGRCVRW
jgi:hypothetical protein